MESVTILDLKDENFVSNLNKIKSEMPNRFFTDVQIEQIRFRMYICSKCLENKRCSFCKCNPLDVISEPYSCNHGKLYPNFLPKSEWENFKKEHNIEIR
jgi:hypothetical protein